jgi:PleD family two-component response regulator
MNKQLSILVVGRNPQIMQTVLRLINNESNMKAVGALTDEMGVKELNKNRFDLVLIGGGVEEVSEQEISKVIESNRLETKVIRHYGGGSGLLFNEIEQAMNQTGV